MVQLPDIKVNLSNTVKVLHDAPKVNVSMSCSEVREV